MIVKERDEKREREREKIGEYILTFDRFSLKSMKIE